MSTRSVPDEPSVLSAAEAVEGGSILGTGAADEAGAGVDDVVVVSDEVWAGTESPFGKNVLFASIDVDEDAEVAVSLIKVEAGGFSGNVFRGLSSCFDFTSSAFSD